jgi:pimeloyl-ACP methyl ester carboxylesterase
MGLSPQYGETVLVTGEGNENVMFPIPRAYKDDLVSIINEIGKPSRLVGASLGGMAYLLLAGDEINSDLCTALIMVDIGIYPDPVGSHRLASYKNSVQRSFFSATIFKTYV